MDKETKVLTFWQNIISPHQVDFLKALSAHYRIILIVDKVIDELRIKDEWNVPNTSFLDLMLKPNEDELLKQFDDANRIHIFSGISSYELVSKGFLIAVKKKARIGLLSEPLDWYGFKGKLRFIKSVIERKKFEKNIDFILTIGNKGYWWFSRIGYPKDVLFKFGYFVDSINRTYKVDHSENKDIIYVGRINENKGIFDLIKIIAKNKNIFNKLYVYGGGILVNKFKDEIDKNELNEKVVFRGIKPNSIVKDQIGNCRLLILPSKGKDGWGVVVNEALQMGTRVLVSNNVGASVLLEDKNRGLIFDANNLIDFERKFQEGMDLKFGSVDRSNIAKWSIDAISPKKASMYLKEIVNYVYENKNVRPTPPWIKKY